MPRPKRRLRDRITSLMYLTFILTSFVLVTSLLRDDLDTAMTSVLVASSLLPLFAYLRFLLRPRRRRRTPVSKPHHKTRSRTRKPAKRPVRHRR